MLNLSAGVKRELYIFKTLPPLPESGGMGYDTKTEEIFLSSSSIYKSPIIYLYKRDMILKLAIKAQYCGLLRGCVLQYKKC